MKLTKTFLIFFSLVFIGCARPMNENVTSSNPVDSENVIEEADTEEEDTEEEETQKKLMM